MAKVPGRPGPPWSRRTACVDPSQEASTGPCAGRLPDRLGQRAVEVDEPRAVDQPEEGEQEERQDQAELDERLTAGTSSGACPASGRPPAHGETCCEMVALHEPLVVVSVTVYGPWSL